MTNGDHVRLGFREKQVKICRERTRNSHRTGTSGSFRLLGRAKLGFVIGRFEVLRHDGQFVCAHLERRRYPVGDGARERQCDYSTRNMPSQNFKVVRGGELHPPPCPCLPYELPLPPSALEEQLGVAVDGLQAFFFNVQHVQTLDYEARKLGTRNSAGIKELIQLT